MKTRTLTPNPTVTPQKNSDQRNEHQSKHTQELSKMETVNGIVCYLSKGNVSLQVGRFITQEMLNAKREALANHKFL